MKAHKAKMKGNECLQGQKEWKMNTKKAKYWKIDPVPALLNSLYGRLEKGPFLGTCGEEPQKLTPKEPKCKEIKAHKAKMKGNEGPQGQIKAQKAKMKGNEGVSTCKEQILMCHKKKSFLVWARLHW